MYLFKIFQLKVNRIMTLITSWNILHNLIILNAVKKIYCFMN